MSATNSTTNYNLPIFIASDSPKWLVDWNGAMNTIDSAINTVATAASGVAGDITTLQSDLQTLSGTVTTQGTSISTLSSSLTSLIGTVNTITSLIGNGEPTTTDKTIIGAINEINAKVATTARKVLFIGDSYGMDYTSDGVPITGWLSKMASVLGSKFTVATDSHALSGYGFLSRGTGYKWSEYLETLSSDDGVTDVCFIGGSNDAQFGISDSSFSTYVINTITAAKAKYPNAKIWVGFCAINLNGTEADIKTCHAYSLAATSAGAAIINSLPDCLFERALWLNNDHPNNEGTNVLAWCISSALKGGTYYNGYRKPFAYNNDATVEATSINDLFMVVDNDSFTMIGKGASNHNRFEIRFDNGEEQAGVKKAASGADEIIVGKVTNLPFEGRVILGTCPGVGSWKTLGFYNCSIQFIYDNGYIKISLLGVVPGSGWINGNKADDLLYIICLNPKFRINLKINTTE